MSKLQELIQELCPDGVEYKALGEVCEMQRGTSLTKANSVEGEYPVISGGKEPAFYCNQFKATTKNSIERRHSGILMSIYS